MQTAEALLEIIHERGKKGLPLERLYRHLFNPGLYLRAYGKIYRNDGAMTPGANAETVDGMSLKKIQAIIEALRCERYRWTPVRRSYIDKKHSTKKRPLGLPTWSDKLLQEVLRLLLEAYYEPQLSDRSHGFRPGRGCHTALQEIDCQWHGTVWFIEGDITDCLDPWSHCSFADCRVQKSPSWGVGSSIRRPFLRPVRVRTARSSPRLTFCNTVCRETPRAWLA
jgi:hypothetical protein